MSASLDEQFVQLVNGAQRALYGYIRMLAPSADAAHDILQETNLVIWRQRDAFKLGTNFLAWAMCIALNKTRTYRAAAARDRLVFDDALISQISEESAEPPGGDPRQLASLEHCVKKLSAKDRDLLARRYSTGMPAREIGRQVGRSARAIAQALYRIRVSLMRCIDQSLALKGDDS